MNIIIGENLRKLRRERDLTQEELADSLGITFQAVSKWERGEGYPDITLLPSIANYFEITLDELMGMDQIKKDEFLYKVGKEVTEYTKNEEFNKAEELLRDAIKMYPNENSLIKTLGMTLYFKNINTRLETESIKEAISLCERALKGSLSEKARSTTRTYLCLLYKNLGDDEKAIESARVLPHFWESRELIVPALYEKEEYSEKLRESIKLIISTIYEKITDIEKGNTSMKDINRFLTLGPKNYDFTVSFINEALETIKKYVE